MCVYTTVRPLPVLCWWRSAISSGLSVRKQCPKNIPQFEQIINSLFCKPHSINSNIPFVPVLCHSAVVAASSLLLWAFDGLLADGEAAWNNWSHVYSGRFRPNPVVVVIAVADGYTGVGVRCVVRLHLLSRYPAVHRQLNHAQNMLMIYKFSIPKTFEFWNLSSPKH